SVVVVAFHDKPARRREREEPQHVATGKRRHIGFFGIDAGGIGPWRRHDVRRRRCAHGGTAVELPAMAARIASVHEFVAASLPADRRVMLAHGVRWWLSGRSLWFIAKENAMCMRRGLALLLLLLFALPLAAQERAMAWEGKDAQGKTVH